MNPRFYSLPEENGALSAEAAEGIARALVGKSAAVVGPGLGKAAMEAVRAVLKADLPAVVDADALNILSRNDQLRALLTAQHVITPHPGEAARLVGPVGDDQVEAAIRLRDATGAVALLKGASSVITGEGVHVSASGCGGMATGGSGDVLSGMIGALLAQGVAPETAAWAGSQLHGLAGEAATRRFGERAMTAADIAEAAAQGDRSENFEYYAAKKFRGENESRIRYLERVLKTAVIISDESKDDEVGINNTVVIFDRDMQQEETLRIVTSMRGDMLNGQISIESPIGKALLRHKVGDVVTVNVDSGYSYQVEIREIIKENDESGDRIRSF